jgi:RNA polymerase sigma-70 factor (ECF subfamily)
MRTVDSSTSRRSVRPTQFQTTHWSVILTAAEGQHPDSQEALESLCLAYWKPLYAFVRRSGYAQADAEDLTQGFFEHLLAKEIVKSVNVHGGKFRSYLLVCLKNFLRSEWERGQAQKRGGSHSHIPFEFCDMELEDSSATPDAAFDKAWAVTVLQQAFDLLTSEYKAAGREAIFEQLRIFLHGDRVPLTYGELAERLGTSEGAVKMLVQRMRRRYRECLNAVILATVAHPGDVQEELRELVAALS